VVANDNGDNPIQLSWDAVGGQIYGYNVYRDGMLCRLVQSGTEFLDEQATMGGHCYQLTVLCQGGESALSNLTCATEGPCYPPRNFDYEFKANHKVKLKWEAPVVTDGLSAYFVYRKKDDGEYRRIKLVSAAGLTVDDSSNLSEGDYYYQIKAYYQGMDCYSAPSNVVNEANVFELHVRIEPTGVDEDYFEFTMVPNPTDGMVLVKGENLKQVEVYNVIGQSVMTKNAESNNVVIDMNGLSSGLYFVHVMDQNGVGCVRKLLKQ
jgi:hypothetical protein